MWKTYKKVCTCSYEFSNFAKAIDFMEAVIPYCNQATHMARWQNKRHYVKVTLNLSDTDTCEKAQQKIDEIYYLS